ncbi:MAG: endolytic transglycosylase MltG [Bacteroidales bacterium]|nr:endolytic transglycosylase MltG [Bacteroidales bacterium]
MTVRLKISLVGLAVAVLLAGAAGFVFGRYYSDNKKPNFTQKYVLYVRPEMNASQVMDSLLTGAGTLRPKSLQRAFSKMEVAQKMKPGRYVVDPSSTSIYVARMLVFGWQTPQNMTLSGTLRKKDRIAQRISSQMMVDSASVVAALNDEMFLANYGFTPENVFAMILPDTYEMYWTASIKEIFDRLKKEYDAFWTQERLAKAKNQGLTPMEVSVMASIVSGETLKPFEYPVIAGVYLNRYKKGMKLQADPTIAFCYDYTLDRILKKHLTVDSPYNTYKYVGLPPAPINVPPKACLDAVLNPDKHNYIYFCASPAFDGTHRFAVTYTEHLKNARAFQRELTARRKAKAAAAAVK